VNEIESDEGFFQFVEAWDEYSFVDIEKIL